MLDGTTMEPPKSVLRIVGAILLAFGCVLASFPFLILARHGVATWESGIVVAGTSVLAAFLLLLGFRLFFNRPNRSGSLLSPTGWRVLAICFGIPAAFAGVTAMRSADFTLVILAAATALLAVACVLAGRGHRIEPPPSSRVLPPETSLLQLEGFTPADFRHGVQILNDDRTPMEFVVAALRDNLGLNESEAIQKMLEIHTKGGAILARTSLEEAERVAAAIAEEARLGGHSFQCRAVSIDTPDA